MIGSARHSILHSSAARRVSGSGREMGQENELLLAPGKCARCVAALYTTPRNWAWALVRKSAKL
jgi:hypothetical protein